MKKHLLGIAAVAAMFIAGSCQNEALNPVTDGDTSVTLSVALPSQVTTKAMAQAENTNVVYYEIWNSDWSKQLYPVNNDELAFVPMSDKKATIDLTLVTSQTYNFIFWAQNDACGAYDVNELKNVKVDYSVIGAEGNQDKFDAFYAVKTFKVDGPIDETVTLSRPFAQLNFGADTMVTDLGNITVEKTYITVDRLATVFNTLKGVGETEVNDVVFTATGVATDETLVVGGHPYAWVAMDYMLMMADQDVVEVDASFNVAMDAPVEFNVVNVPLKKNFRTNIVGDLFTSGAVLSIIVDPAFNTPDEDIEGVVPVVSVKTAAELKEAVAAGRNVLVLSDLDLVADEMHVAEGKNVAVDLNGKTLTVKSLDPIRNLGTMTLKNGKVAAENSEATRRCVYNYGTMTIDNVEFVQTYPLKGAAINNAGTMTIESAKVDAEYFAIWNEGDGVMTINSGEFTSRTTSPNEPQYCVILKNSSKLYVNDGTFEGVHGVVASEAQSVAYIYAGTYTCTGSTSSDWVLYANGENEGGAVYYSASCVLNNNGKNSGICGNVNLLN